MVARAKTVEIAPDSEMPDCSTNRPMTNSCWSRGQNASASFGSRATERDVDDIWANYDPEKVREAVEKYSGIITPEEAERWKQEIYRRREEGSRHFD